MTSAQFPVSRSRSRPARKSATYSRLARAAIALAVCAALDPAYAQVGANTLPTAPRVNAGAATVGTSGNKMTVNQTTPKVSIGWESFSIGSKASVTFAQPSSSSVALNRVLGSDPSWIFGSLSANGKVFLINQAGVVFAPGARVNVGGIAASTLDMSDTDFMAGRYVFSGNSTASVVNRGSIITSPGGYAALIGADVANEGAISAPGGSVALAAGSRVTMDLTGDGLLSVSVDAASARAMASNTGLIQADGGRVIVSARASDALMGTVLNQSGIIEARSASMRNGEIVLDGGSNGIVAVSGKMDVSGTQPGATGGKVTVTGNLVGLSGADINASGDAGGGTILIGGDYQGKNPDVRNAARTYVDSGSILNADAITFGNGGKVIVWADDATAFYGSITARGGAQGGDGGFAEVSGKQTLIYAGFTDLRAPLGKTGTLLLDPADVVIDAGGTDSVADASAFLTAFGAGDGSGTVTISPADLETALTGATVQLFANNDITVQAAVDASGLGPNSLVLEAGRSIAINANISLDGSFTAIANSTGVGDTVVPAFRSAGNGGFTMNNGTSIATGGGNIQISVLGGAAPTFDSGSITIANLDAGSGHVYINQGGQTPGSHILRTTNSAITATSVALDISNVLNTTGTIGSLVTGPIAVATDFLEARSQGGAILLQAIGPVEIGGATLGGLTGVNAGTGNVTLTTDDAVTQSEAMTGNTLTVKTLNDTAGNANIALDLAVLGLGVNEFTSVDLRTRNAADNANAGSTISYRDATGFDVAAAHSTGSVTLVGGGAITDGATGTLTGSTLAVTTRSAGVAAITLDNAGHEFASVNLRARDVADANNTAGAITYVDATGFTAAARSASTVNLTATTGNITVDATPVTGSIITDSGAVTLTALAAGASINSAVGANINTTNVAPGAAVTLRADNLNLLGSITAGNGLVTLTPNADAMQIRVGQGATDSPIFFGIDDSELTTITTTGGLTIGSATNTGGIEVVAGSASAPGVTVGTFTLLTDTGSILVNGALTSATNTTLQTTSGNIVFGGGSITASGFTVNLTATGGNIQGDAGLGTNDVTALTLSALASTGIGAGPLVDALETAVTNLSFANTTGVVQITNTINTLPSGVTVSGTNAGTGAVNITETLGNLTVGATGIVTNSGIVTLTASAADATIFRPAAAFISTIGGATAGADVNLIADNMDLAGVVPTAINSGTATTTLVQFTPATVLIDLGGADAAGTLGLTPAELNTITAGKIKIGDVNTGAMEITGLVQIAPTGTSLLSLESGSTITQMTSTATIFETNLALRAGTGIDLTAAGSGVAGIGNTVTNLAAVTSGAGDISFRNNATMTVGVVDGVDGISTNSGNISVTVAGASAGATNLFIDKVAAGGNGTVTLVASNSGAGQANIFEAPLGGGTGDSPDFDITTTGALSMNAKNDIGQPSGIGAGPIEISVGSAAWVNGPGGASYLLQTGDLDLTGMTTDGDVNIEVIGTITTSGDLVVNGNTSLTSIGDGEDIIISNGIIRNNDSAGFVTLKAQRHVILDANGYILAQNVNLGGDGKTIVTLNSDSNALNGGAILIENNTSFASITSNNGPVILGGGLNPLTAAAIGTDFNVSTLFNGIDLQGAIVSGTGNVNLLGQSFYGGGQTGVSGVTVNNGGSITTTTGNITIKGIGDQGAGNTQGVLITDSGTLLTTTSGTVFVEGLHVNNVSGGNNVGVLVRDGAVISSTSAGAAGLVTLKGTGGAGLLDADHGVVVTGGASVTVSGANLILEGTGGGGVASGGANSVGVQIAGGAIVETIGTGLVKLIGTGGATNGGLNYGIEITDLNTRLRATDTGSTALRIDLVGVGGAGGATGADNYGILVRNNAQVTANNSHIAFSGTGGASDGGNNFGIAVLNSGPGGGVVESLRTVSGAGDIAFTGVGGAGTGNNDTGIVISGANSRVTTHFGNITFTGTGGTGAADTGASNRGILIASAAAVESDGVGQIGLNGTGSATANGGDNFGVFIDSNGVVRNTSTANLVTPDGKITVTGLGGLGTGAGDGGIGLAGGGTVSSVNSEIQLQGTGGAGTVGGQSYGVYSNGGIVATSGDGNILIVGTGGAAAGGSNYGIYTLGSAQITSSAVNAVNPAGTITLSGTAGTSSTSGDNIGINVTGGTTVTSLDGKIDLFGTGTGTGTGTGSHGVRIATNSSIASTGLAVIEIDGFGATQGAGNAIGILVDSGAAITSTGPGTAGGSTITLTGTGGGTAGGGNDNFGIQVNGFGSADTKITSVAGNILLTGTGGGQTPSTGNAGIKVSGQADIVTSGAARIDLIGQSGITNGANNYGVWIDGALTTVHSTTTAAATGDINIQGTGRGTGTNAFGVLIDNSAQVLTQGLGDVTITGIGSTAGTGSAVGIQMANAAGVVSNTGTGTITLTGTGGSTAVSGNSNTGINILTNSQVTSVTGNIVLSGTGGGTGAATSNIGVVIASGSDVVSSGAATIGITGLSGLTTGAGNYGVYINGTGVAGETSVRSTGPAGGTIIIAGTGRGAGGTEHGVLMDAGALVQSLDGNTSITGTSSATAGNANYGIRMMSGADVISTGTATLALTGTGGLGTGTDNFGIYMGGSGTSVDSQGTGTVTLTGTGRGSGGTERGILMDSAARVTSVSGSIALTGTSSATGGSDNAGIVMDSNADVISTGTASIVLTGNGASNDATQRNYGIHMMGGADVSSTQSAAGGGTILLDGNAGAGSIDNYGVLIKDSGTTVTTNRGNITILGDGAVGTTKGNSNIGVAIIDAAAVTSAGSGAGNIVITGAGAAGTAFNYGAWLDNGADVTSSGTGTIAVTGTAGAGTGNNNIGVQIADLGTTVTAVGGNITVNGTGGGSAATTNNYGVNVELGALIETTGAATIGLTGTGGATTGSSNHGVRIDGSGTIVRSTATGSHITIVGNGAGTGNSEIGVLLNNSALVTSAGAGNIGITGTGAAGGANNYGIQVAGNADVTSTGTGTITLTGVAGAGTGNANYGVSLTGTASTVSSVSGNIVISGTGGGSAGTADNYGVYVNAGADVLSTGAASIGITGQSGITTGTGNIGVRIQDLGTTVISSGTATSDITITGTGRGTGSGAQGVLIDTNALVRTTGAGDIFVIGTSNATGTGGSNHGVQISVGADVETTGAGLIDITGTSGDTSGGNNWGVYLASNGTTVASTGAGTTGTITLTGHGRGTAGGTNNVGVVVDTLSLVSSLNANISITGDSLAAAGSNVGVFLGGAADVVSTGTANILINGTGSNTSGAGNYGVWIRTAGATVDSQGTGSVTITGQGGGTGANEAGVVIDTASLVKSASGPISITGTGSASGTTDNWGVQVASGADVISTGGASATILIDGTGGGGTNANHGVYVTGNGTTIDSVTGNITLQGDGGGVGASNIGVIVDDLALVRSTGAATVNLLGNGATGPGTTGNHGVQVSGDADITSSSTGAVTLTGTAGGGTADNYGVLITGNGTTVTGVGGLVHLTGTGAGTGGSGVGVSLESIALVRSTGAGGVEIDGTGSSGGGNGNVGVRVLSDADVNATSTGGIAIDGLGGNTSGTLNDGVLMTGTGTTVQTTSSAAMITGTGGGTGGDSVGVAIFSGALAGTATGSVTVTGTGSGADAISYGILMGGGTVQSTGSGSLALIGNGLGVAADIFTSGGGNTIGNGGMTGEILLRSLGSVGTVSDATILTSGGAGIVTLNAEGGGGFNQTGGSVVSNSLRFLGSGTFSLTDPGGANAVNNIAGTLADTSALTYVQAGSVNVAALTSFQDGVGINQTTSFGFDIAGASSTLAITSGGITQSANAPIVVPGTTTLTDGGNNIILNNPGNLFGTVNVVSANDVTLGGTSIGLGDVNVGDDLTINAGTLTDSGTVIVPGLATFNVTGDMLLDSPASDFNTVTFNVGGNASLTDANDLIVNTSTIGGNLALIAGLSLNTAPFNIVTVGGTVSLTTLGSTPTSGGIGTLNNDFHLNTPGTITLSITGAVPPFTLVSGFVVNDGSGLLNLLPPTQLVRFNVVEFQPPTPVTAAMYMSKEYADVPLEELTDLIYVTDDPAEQEYPGVRGRIGRLKNGADVHRDGGVRMPPGLVSSGGDKPAADTEIDRGRGSRFLFRN